MAEWVKIKSGATSARMFNRDWPRYVELSFADMRPAGFYPVDKILPRPVPAEGEELGYTYELVGDVMRKTYFVGPPPPPVRSFNRYKVVMALKSEGVWKAIRAAMLAEDEDALDMLYTAEDISEDEPLLLGMIAILKSDPFNWTDDKVEEILSSVVNNDDA